LWQDQPARPATTPQKNHRVMPELSFKGKEFVFNHHLAVPHRPLVPDASKSVGEPRLDGNLVLLHGDTSLKSLLPLPVRPKRW